MSQGRLLRWTAVAIAVAAAIDPAIAVNRRVRPKVALITDSRERYENPGPSESGAQSVIGTRPAQSPAGLSRRPLAKSIRASSAREVMPSLG